MRPSGRLLPTTPLRSSTKSSIGPHAGVARQYRRTAHRRCLPDIVRPRVGDCRCRTMRRCTGVVKACQEKVEELIREGLDFFDGEADTLYSSSTMCGRSPDAVFLSGKAASAVFIPCLTLVSLLSELASGVFPIRHEGGNQLPVATAIRQDDQIFFVEPQSRSELAAPI